jgi:A/G-specific adenine glycosylase
MSLFATRLIDWQRRHGRHDLPWQRDWQRKQDPYHVWVSEIMLQQTQVGTAAPYYERFISRFPGLAALAAAPAEEVMALWSGLGYYARARNLHRCAREVVVMHGGTFPGDPVQLAALPGIGRSTANAIAAFCFGARVPILDGNVKRLLCRFLGIEGFPGAAAVESRLWRHAGELLPQDDAATYIQAQMDIGATVCTRGKPRCDACPLADLCVARQENRIADLPTPRPKRQVPERSVTLLVLCSGSRVMLERRPPSGIWGGLLSPPELPEGQDAAAWCRERLGMAVGAVSPAPTFVHAFTHFRLTIRPLVCDATALPLAAEPGMVWVGLDDLPGAALPAPVRKLLSAIP